MIYYKSYFINLQHMGCLKWQGVKGWQAVEVERSSTPSLELDLEFLMLASFEELFTPIV
jgi:hypothetical protein